MKRESPVADIFKTCRSHFVQVITFSAAIGFLYLASPIYMMQVYDRVISSGSELTLLMLTLGLMIAFAALGSLEAVRSRLLARASVRLEREFAVPLMRRLFERPGPVTAQTMKDFEQIRQFVRGSGLVAFVDLPFTLLSVGVIFLLHPLLGGFSIACVATLVALALITRYLSRNSHAEAEQAAGRNQALTENALLHRELIGSMGIGKKLLSRWSTDRNSMILAESGSGDISSGLDSLSRILRTAMQSLILALSAWLVIQHELSAAAILPASVLLGRALQPIGQITGSWRSILKTRAALTNVSLALSAKPAASAGVELPNPTGEFEIDGLIYSSPELRSPILRGVTLRAAAGETMLIGGGSGAGKTTLGRLLVGVVQPLSGTVTIDGIPLPHWPRDQLGRHIGYLPQDVRLLPGTLADNIGRFGEDNSEAIIEAAKLAGVHKAIVKLPSGYETSHSDADRILPASTRQLIALARAVYDTPALVVLDDPNSHLDLDGEKALSACVKSLKAAGSTVVILTHRTNLFEHADTLVVLKDGAIKAAGPRGDVLTSLSRPAPQRAAISPTLAASR